MHGENRMSRLPPLTIANSLNQARPTYFRSASAEAGAGNVESPLSPTSPGATVPTEVEAPANRPISVHPQLSGAPPLLPPEPSPQFDFRDEEQWRGRRPAGGPEYFGARREQSPPPLDREQRSFKAAQAPTSYPQPRPSVESMRQRAIPARRLDDWVSGVGGYNPRALAPPRSPFANRTPSPRSMSESSDDDYSISNGPHSHSPHRKLSGNSGLSTSPLSPSMKPAIPRSPSISSEISVGGTRLPRPAFNFSRPLSRASIQSVSGPPVDVPRQESFLKQESSLVQEPPPEQDIPSRQASSDSQPSFILADDTAHTPVSMHSEGFPDTTNDTGAAPSYIYSKFSLPRGKMLQRNSLIFQDNLPQAQYQWGQPVSQSNVQPYGGAPPSPPSRPSTSSHKPEQSQLRPSFDRAGPSFDMYRPSTSSGRPSMGSRPSFEPERPSTERGRPSERRATDRDHAQSTSIASSGTIKAPSQHSLVPSAEMSAEENVSKAIKFHEEGSLTKSTYHLRLAARQNHPTAMLLYALACRHGWGMRPNQKEGVAWLRKAAEFAQLEIADDEDLLKDGKAVDVVERKTRKAQFALSIYELGVSHMNGWGIEQDKVLALRCFEIAGSWGDADALAEAGFCYAQGQGCKKDLKKSARLYRQAESKGISMVGNSWIYKAKYADDNEPAKTSLETARGVGIGSPEKKKRDKSRTRTMFGRMKSNT